MFKLTILDDEGKNTVVPLPSGRDEFTIGRKDGNTIRLTERNVSRQHARLVRSNGSFYIEDKGSYTGVKVNGDRITGRRHIKEGDEIKIGDYHLSLAVEKAIEKEAKANGKANGSSGSGTAVISLSPAQQKKLLAGEKEKAPSVDKGRLCLLSGPLAGKLFGIERDEVVIGRTDDNDIVLNHRSISRNHAKIIVTGNVHQIVDLGSANGIRVNGEEYGKIDLRKGDKIDLGHVRLRFVGPGEDFTYDASMKEDVVGGDDGPESKGGAGVWIGVVMALAVIGGVGAYVLGYIGPKAAVVDPNKKIEVSSNPTPPKICDPATCKGTCKPDGNCEASVVVVPGEDKTALLKQAKDCADKKDWQCCEAKSKAAGDDAKAAQCFAEGNAQEFLALCKDAVKDNKTEDIITYCYEALKESTNTSTYKEYEATLTEGKAKYKEKTLEEVKSLLDKAEAGSKTTDGKTLSNAKSQANTAKDKLDNVTKFSGTDDEVSKAEARTNAVLDKLKTVKAVCEESECAKQNKTCNVARGVCEAKPVVCPETCEFGCKGKTTTCKPDPSLAGPVCPASCTTGCKADGVTCNTSSVVTPGKCDAAACPGGCNPDGTCLATKTKEELADEVRATLATPEGCNGASKLLEELRKAGGTADYYYYKAYCYGDSNPEKACDNYIKFLKAARGDTRVSQAKQFINSQDATTYTTCILPTP